jgi:Zn-finger nucleic acid-binding protein
MATETHQGVQLDVCSAHGSWFDAGEVSSLIQRIRSGERLSKSRAVREARRDGKVGGMLFGALSLLFDDE